MHGLRALPDAGAVAVALGDPFDAGIVDRRRNEAVGDEHGGAGIGRREGVHAARDRIFARGRIARHRRKRSAVGISDAGIAGPRPERRRDRYIIWTGRGGHARGLARHGVTGIVTDNDVLPAFAKNRTE